MGVAEFSLMAESADAQEFVFKYGNSRPEPAAQSVFRNGDATDA